MKILARRAVRLLWETDGPTAVEYAFMLALIIVVCLTAIQGISSYPKTQFSTVANSIGGGS